MTLEDHIGLFLVLLLAGFMLLELRRYFVAQREDGEGAYPRRRLSRRFVAFLFLEASLVSFILPRRLGLVSLGWQLASLGMGLVFALLAMIPVLRDWREMRLEMMGEAEKFAAQTSEALKRAIEQELHKGNQTEIQDKAQE